MTDVYAALAAAEHLTVELDLTTPVGTFRAVTCEVVEGLSEIGHAIVELGSEVELSFVDVLEGGCTLEISMAGVPFRTFTMKLAEARFRGVSAGELAYVLELRPALHFLRHGRNIRKFRDQTTEAIVSAVLSEGGVRHRWQTTRPCASRPYTVQYRESNLDFVLRLLEWEGIHYFFEDDGTMVLADRSPASERVVGPATFGLQADGGALDATRPRVTSLGRGARLGSGSATVNDYDWRKPKAKLIASAAGARDTDLEVYRYPGGYRDPGVGPMLANLRLEALVADKRFVEGTSSVPTFAAGRIFDFVHEEGAELSGSYLLRRVRHTYETARSALSEARPARYENAFDAVFADVPFRPPLVTPVPVVAGCHTAMVRGPIGEEIHTDAFGRAKVQFHWDREATGTDADSRWIRVVQETSSSMALARVGWEVNVGYILGDADRPIALARNINGQMVPTYAQPSSKNVMTVKTETYPGRAGFNELRMDDSAGSQRIDIHAQKDLSNVVKNDQTERIANDDTQLVKKSVNFATRKTQTVTVGTDEKLTVDAEHRLTVKLDRTRSVGGGEKVSVGTSYQVNVAGHDTETVGGVRRTMTGMLSIPIPTAKELMKELVPSTEKLAGAFVGSALGPAFGAAAEAATGGKGAEAAAKAFGGGLPQGGKPLLGLVSDAIRGPSPGPSGGAAGGPGGAAGGPSAGPAGAPAGSGAGAAGGLAGALGVPSGPPDIAGAIKGLVPSPQSVLSKATGGLSDVRSVQDLMKYLTGAITRNVEKSQTRTVGAALIQVAGGGITHEGSKLLVEAVGGAKITIAAKESIAQSTGKYQVTTVGGMILKKAKSDITVGTQRNTVKVGGFATLVSDEKIELRGEEIELVASEQFTLKQGDVLIEMTPSKVTLKGDVRLDAVSKIQVFGKPDDLTGG